MDNRAFTLRGVSADRCDECGGRTAIRSCREHFHALLALDFDRTGATGAYHTLNVACYGLQHPSEYGIGGAAAQIRFLVTFLDRGLGAVQLEASAAVARNSHRSDRAPHPTVAESPVPEPASSPFAVTIEDVAVDGSFPAVGYPDRMRRWAAATLGRPVAPEQRASGSEWEEGVR